ncbi:C4-dicarboxylate ABC transporter substrate-binding protein [Synergistales bacterium]|nr:C4-dicarboxylate ABC transporter substrate-binding protein [Synergistales bacterium]
MENVMKNKPIRFLLIIAVFLVILALALRMRHDNLPSRIKIAAGNVSGIYHAYGAALAEVLKPQLNVPVDVLITGGSVENIRFLRNGRADLAFVQNDSMTYAYNGTNIFSTEGAFKDFSALAGLYPEVCQIVAREKIEGEEILSIRDLDGKRVSIGEQGGGTELNALQILAAYGLSDTEIEVSHLGFDASVEAFRSGTIDAFFCTAGVPTPAILDLAKLGGVRLLSIGDAHISALITNYPFYTKHIIPAGVYPGMEYANYRSVVSTVAVRAALVASDQLSVSTVSAIYRILFEKKAELAALCEKAGDLNRETAADGLLIPLHRGVTGPQ